LCEREFRLAATSPPFDFHCVPGNHFPAAAQTDEGEPLEWYAICGSPFVNRAEAVFTVWSNF
jgi:hypothetical protein